MQPTLESVFDQAWNILNHTISRKPSKGAVALATVDPKSQPQVCLVVLRAIDRREGLLEFHTDSDSLKCKSLLNNPKAQILIWRPDLLVQLRISIQIRLCQSMKSKNLWKKVPKSSRISYGKAPPTGTKLQTPFDYKTTLCEKNFVVAECHLWQVDFLSLKERHFRAKFCQDSDWVGQWISP